MVASRPLGALHTLSEQNPNNESPGCARLDSVAFCKKWEFPKIGDPNIVP